MKYATDYGYPIKPVYGPRDVEGFDYEEAAAVLGVPVGTIRSRLSRARAMLKEWSTE